MNKIPVIIDSDPGVDDAVALVMALNSDKLDVKMVCSTAGNVSIDYTTANTLFITKRFGGDVPVGKGLGHPVSRQFVDASDVHGAGGVGGFVIPNHDYKIDYEDGISAMYDELMKAEEPVTLITLGPLSNIAELLTKHPEAAEKIKVISAMIASYNGRGNVTEYAEFNAYCDPEALDIVVKSGVPMTFAPMHIGNETKLLQADILDKTAGTYFGEMMTDIFKDYHELAAGEEYLAMYDSNAVFSLISPEYYNFVPCTVTVNTDDKPGQTIMDEISESKYHYLTAKDSRELAGAMLKEVASHCGK